MANDSIPSAPGIYKLLNLVTQKCYIGSALNIGDRIDSHWGMLNRGSHHSKRLQRSWDKHGGDSFAVNVVEIVEDVEFLVEREQFWIDHFDSYKHGYNSSPTAGSQLGYKHTEQSKERMSVARRGVSRKPHSPETLEKLSAAAKKRGIPSSVIEAATLKNTGRPLTPEHRAKISAANKGMVFDKEVVAKRSEKLRGRTFSPETLRRMSEGQRGKKLTEEHIAKVVSKTKGKKRSQESIERYRIAATKREAKKKAERLAQQEQQQAA